MSDTDKQLSNYTIYRRMLAEARPHWKAVAALLAVSLVSAPLTLLNPLPLKIAVDSAVDSKPLPGPLARWLPGAITDSPEGALWLACGLTVAIALATQIVSVLTNVLRTLTSERLVHTFQARVFAHLQRLSLSFHDERGTADSLHRLQHDTSSIYTFAVDGVIPFLTAACTIAAMFYVSLRIDWQLTLIAVAVCPFLVVLARVYGRVLRRTARESKRLETDAYTVMHESLAALRVVKAFGQENREEKRFVSRSLASIRARVRMAVQSGTFGVLIGLTIACGTAAVLLIGVWHVRSGTLTLGSLLLVIGYLAQLYGPLRILSTKLTGMQKYFANAERVFSLLDEAPEVIDYPHAHRLDRAQGAVSFNNVTFAYEADVPILESAGFAVEAGTCVGIVGTTGHGKTTLLNLLPRFFDPDLGSIALDGVDIRNYRLADLRRQFAIVLQDSVLFSTSISENISYARPDATEAEIVKAAQAANAHGFIMDMPQGYETRVGERGMRLSGGERQRIALARAFLMDAPLLLLDEPTSAVDVRTEAEILSIIDRLAAGRTTFMVSHRLSALKNCSMLLHVEHGRVTVRPPEFVDSLS